MNELHILKTLASLHLRSSNGQWIGDKCVRGVMAERAMLAAAFGNSGKSIS